MSTSKRVLLSSSALKAATGCIGTAVALALALFFISGFAFKNYMTDKGARKDYEIAAIVLTTVFGACIVATLPVLVAVKKHTVAIPPIKGIDETNPLHPKVTYDLQYTGTSKLSNAFLGLVSTIFAPGGVTIAIFIAVIAVSAFAAAANTPMRFGGQNAVGAELPPASTQDILIGTGIGLTLGSVLLAIQPLILAVSLQKATKI